MPKGKGGKKSVAVYKTHESKVNEVVKWVLSGANAHDIRQAIDVTFPTDDAAGLILEAMETFKEAADCQADVMAGWCISASMEMYRRMVEIGDFPGALRAVKLIRELTQHVQDEEPNEEQVIRGSEAIRLRQVTDEIADGPEHRAGASG